MLTDVDIIHPRFTNVPFSFNIATTQTDSFYIRDIEGFGPVASELSLTPHASGLGDHISGIRRGSRNLVLTLGMRPNYAANQSFSLLRQAAYKYFMPGQSLTVEINTTLLGWVEIVGTVETVEPAIFTDDPTMTVSILCPDPDFISKNTTTIVGDALLGMNVSSPKTTIDYTGTTPTGFELRIFGVSGAHGGTNNRDFDVSARAYPVNLSVYEERFKARNITLTTKPGPFVTLNTNYGQKNLYVTTGTDDVINIDKMTDDSKWPQLYPGDNFFFVRTDNVSPNLVEWELYYRNRYGGL